MKTFAFITHPANLKQLREFWPITKILPDSLVSSLAKNILPDKIFKLACPLRKDEIRGYVIVSPLLPEQFLNSGKGLALNKIIKAGHLAENLGSQILGLGGYAAAMADRGYTVAKSLKIPVTSGSVFTAWSVFEGVYRVAKAKKIALEKSTLTIIAADSSVAGLCSQKFAGCVEKIILCDKAQDKLDHLKGKIMDLQQAAVVIEEDAKKALAESGIVITVEEWPKTGISQEDFRPESIVCDISLSGVSGERKNSRTDITFIRGGLVKLPCEVDLKIDTNGLPKDVSSASLAETMLLTFEGRFVNYSLGEVTNLDKLEEIADLAIRYGFEVWVPEAPVL